MKTTSVMQLIIELEKDKERLLSQSEEAVQEYDDDSESDKLSAKAEGIEHCIEKMKALLKEEL